MFAKYIWCGFGKFLWQNRNTSNQERVKECTVHTHIHTTTKCKTEKWSQRALAWTGMAFLVYRGKKKTSEVITRNWSVQQTIFASHFIIIAKDFTDHHHIMENIVLTQRCEIHHWNYSVCVCVCVRSFICFEHITNVHIKVQVIIFVQLNQVSFVCKSHIFTTPPWCLPARSLHLLLLAHEINGRPQIDS